MGLNVLPWVELVNDTLEADDSEEARCETDDAGQRQHDKSQQTFGASHIEQH